MIIPEFGESPPHSTSILIPPSLLTAKTRSWEGHPNLLVNETGIIVCANSKAEDLFGSIAGGLFGKLVHTLLPDALQQKHIQLLKDYMRNPRAGGMNYGRVITGKRLDDGKEVQAFIFLDPYFEDEGRGNNLYVIAAIFELKTNGKPHQ